MVQGRNRDIFLGFSWFFPDMKSLFPIFSRHDFSLFLVEISILVDHEKVYSFPESEKQKRKGPQFFFSVIFHCIFLIFHLSFWFLKIFLNFYPSFFHFSLCSSTFPIFLPFFLASFFLISHQIFPSGKSRRGVFCPPPSEMVVIYIIFLQFVDFVNLIDMFTIHILGNCYKKWNNYI